MSLSIDHHRRIILCSPRIRLGRRRSGLLPTLFCELPHSLAGRLAGLGQVFVSSYPILPLPCPVLHNSTVHFTVPYCARVAVAAAPSRRVGAGWSGSVFVSFHLSGLLSVPDCLIRRLFCWHRVVVVRPERTARAPDDSWEIPKNTKVACCCHPIYLLSFSCVSRGASSLLN